jgi:hypothetical protein
MTMHPFEHTSPDVGLQQVKDTMRQHEVVRARKRVGLDCLHPAPDRKTPLRGPILQLPDSRDRVVKRIDGKSLFRQIKGVATIAASKIQGAGLPRKMGDNVHQFFGGLSEGISFLIAIGCFPEWLPGHHVSVISSRRLKEISLFTA